MVQLFQKPVTFNAQEIMVLIIIMSWQIVHVGEDFLSKITNENNIIKK